MITRCLPKWSLPVVLQLWTLLLSYLSPNFFKITYMNCCPKIDCGHCPKNDNQHGYKNVHPLSICMCGHSNVVIYHPVSSIFHIWTSFIKLHVFLSLSDTARPSCEYYWQVYFVHSGLHDENLQVTISYTIYMG